MHVTGIHTDAYIHMHTNIYYIHSKHTHKCTCKYIYIYAHTCTYINVKKNNNKKTLLIFLKISKKGP